jgi:hypothetical protein
MRLGETLTRWRAGLRARRSGRTRRSITTAWLTGVLFATATALLSAALGLLPAEVDNALKHGWGGAGQAVSSASVMPWRAFPRVADGIAEWVIKQAAASSCERRSLRAVMA